MTIDLTKYHTKQLLNFLRRTYIGEDGSHSIDEWDEWVSPEELKAELAKRPHVLNKKEAREKRIALIKKGK